MIEILVNIRFGLLWMIPISILITIYFGIRKMSNEKYKNKAIIALISIFVIPILVLFYNALLASVIVSDIKNNVKTAGLNNNEILLNQKETDLTIEDVHEVLQKLNFFHTRNHTHDLERYKITIVSETKNYSFSFYRDSGNENLYWLYTDEYNYELELTNVNTNIFKE